MSVVRWNRQDLLIRPYVGADTERLGEKLGYDVEMSPDSYNYVQYTNYYNGQDVSNEVVKPYSYRFFVPFVASFLPFDSLTSLNIINLSCEILGLLYLMKILSLIGFRSRTIFLTSLLYAISFPVFYYGVVGLLDAPAVFLIMAGVYYTLRNQYIAIILIILVGAMSNEKSILLLPFFFFYNLKEKGFKKSFLSSTLLFLLFVGVTILVRAYTINAGDSYIWAISTDTLIDNLSRVRTYISLILTGGFPLIIFFVALRNTNFKESHNYAFLMGTIFVGLMIIYSFMAAYTDGRFMWYAYPFILPIAANAIDKYFVK